MIQVEINKMNMKLLNDDKNYVKAKSYINV